MPTLTERINEQLGQTPLQEIGIDGFTALARTTERVELKSRAPISYVEDGAAISDHIINEPAMLTVQGVVGDVFVRKTQAEELTTKANARIGATEIYLPALTQSQIQKANAAASTVRDAVRAVDNLVAAGKTLAGVGDNTNENPQKAFVERMQAAHVDKRLIEIQMPFKVYSDMRVVSFTTTRTSRGNEIEFVITAQKIRKAQPVYRLNQAAYKNASDGVSAQTQGQSDNGAQTGGEASPSFIKRIFG